MWDYVVPATAIVLAVMGIIPALNAFDGRKKSIWIACIVSVSLLSLLASFFSIQSMHGDQGQLLGGDKFVSVTVRNIGGKSTLLVENHQPIPVYDVSIDILNILKEATSKPILVGTVPATNQMIIGYINTGVELPVGTYAITIRTRRGTFFEYLDLYEENGTVRECHQITKALDDSVKLENTCAY